MGNFFSTQRDWANQQNRAVNRDTFPLPFPNLWEPTPQDFALIPFIIFGAINWYFFLEFLPNYLNRRFPGPQRRVPNNPVPPDNPVRDARHEASDDSYELVDQPPPN